MPSVQANNPTFNPQVIFGLLLLLIIGWPMTATSQVSPFDQKHKLSKEVLSNVSDENSAVVPLPPAEVEETEEETVLPVNEPNVLPEEDQVENVLETLVQSTDGATEDTIASPESEVATN